MTTLEEIYEMQRKLDADRIAIAMMAARNKVINDAFQAFVMIQNAQTEAFMYATLNPNFCKPEPK